MVRRGAVTQGAPAGKPPKATRHDKQMFVRPSAHPGRGLRPAFVSSTRRHDAKPGAEMSKIQRRTGPVVIMVGRPGHACVPSHAMPCLLLFLPPLKQQPGGGPVDYRPPSCMHAARRREKEVFRPRYPVHATRACRRAVVVLLRRCSCFSVRPTYPMRAEHGLGVSHFCLHIWNPPPVPFGVSYLTRRQSASVLLVHTCNIDAVATASCPSEKLAQTTEYEAKSG
jgi:hypothetical protein